MTSKERIVAALEGQPTDRTPWSPFLAYVWEHFPKEIQELGQPEFLRRVGADPMWRGAGGPVQGSGPSEIEYRSFEENGVNITVIETPVGSVRSGYKPSPQGNTSFLVEHALKKEEDFKVWLWIEERQKYVYNDQYVKDHLAGAGGEGLTIGMLIPRCKSAYQSMVEHLVGTEELVYAGVDYPQTVKTLWQQMVANDLEAVRLACQCEDLTYFLTWEDSGTQNYSPTQYDQFIGSEIGQWCDIMAAAGKKYVQHACGNVKALIKRMVAHGTSVIESISPPPTGDISIADARRAMGNRMGIIGGIEPTMFLNLSIEQLEPYVRGVIADAAGGPFVLANSDSCPPGVTMEKFKLVGDIVRNP
ncbi:MAG: uroporphyrinogen decarboxylase family protein [Planctomycetaceae bacterium]|nr:hypothetical protein [Planctomycetaceae bacterium]